MSRTILMDCDMASELGLYFFLVTVWQSSDGTIKVMLRGNTYTCCNAGFRILL